MWFVLTFLGSALLMVTCGQLALRPWKATVGQHWTERARALWTARVSVNLLMVTCTAMPTLAWLFYGEGHPPFFSLIGGGALGAILGGYPFARSVNSRTFFKPWLQRQIMMLMLLAVRLGLYFWLLLTLPGHMSAWDWERVALSFAILAFIQTGWWIPWLVRSNETTPSFTRLRTIVETESTETKVPVRHVWLSEMPYANAMALVLCGDLVFTQRLLDVLNDEEVAAVCRHELAHLAEPRALKVVRVMGSLYWLPLVFMHPVMERFGPFSGLFFVLLVFLPSRMVRKLRNRLEKRADAAALVSEAPPAVYARALEKLYEANQMPAVNASKRAVHPSLYDRMIAAGVQPGYPRPKAPSSLGLIGFFALLIPMALMVGRGMWLAFRQY